MALSSIVRGTEPTSGSGFSEVALRRMLVPCVLVAALLMGCEEDPPAAPDVAPPLGHYDA